MFTKLPANNDRTSQQQRKNDLIWVVCFHFVTQHMDKKDEDTKISPLCEMKIHLICAT